MIIIRRTITSISQRQHEGMQSQSMDEVNIDRGGRYYCSHYDCNTPETILN